MNDDLTIDEPLRTIADSWKSHKPIPLNIFRLVSDVYYRENFHSDIIAALMEPRIHHESIPIFIRLLERLGPPRLALDPRHYVDALVSRERGRTDILVESPDKRCIIVESKINNACDRPGQLSAYFDAAKQRGLTPEAVVYLSIDGKMEPKAHAFHDNNRADVERVLVKLAAFAGKGNDLVDQWLRPLLAASSDNNLTHLIEQYIDILTEIGEYMMNADTKKEFMDLLRKNPEYFRSAECLAALFNDRAHLLFEEIASRYSDQVAKSKYNIISVRPERYRGSWYVDIVVRAMNNGTVKVGMGHDNNDILLWVIPDDELGKEALDRVSHQITPIIPPFPREHRFAWPEKERDLISAIESLLDLLRS